MENRTRTPSDQKLPSHVKYWLTDSDDYDCFFDVGPDAEPRERIGAFKAFLMGYSEPFRVMLGKGELSEPGDIRLPDLTPNTFKTFLKCMYHGSCDEIVKELNFEDSSDLLYLVEKYMVTHFKCTLTGHMVKLLEKSYNYIFTALKHPVCLQEGTLEKTLSNILWHKTPEIISNSSFLEISEDGLMFILKRPFLRVPEVNLWKAVVKWAHHPNKTDIVTGGKVLENRDVTKFLKEMHFSDMSCVEFCTEVVSTNILKGDEIVDLCKSFREKMSHTNSRLTDYVHSSNISFTHTLRNISEWQPNENVKSSSFHNFQNMTFSLKLKVENKRTVLYLACESRAKSRSELCNEKIKKLLCKADAKVIFLNPRGARSITPNCQIGLENITFMTLNSGSEYEICHLDTFLSENDHLCVNDSVIIEVTIRINNRKPDYKM